MKKGILAVILGGVMNIRLGVCILGCLALAQGGHLSILQ